MTDETRVQIGEYASVVRAAAREGWLLDLVAAHLLPCTTDDARRLVTWARRTKGDLPADTRIRFTNNRGHAYFRRGRYLISLPTWSGTGYARLRAGLVLHEAAHVIDRRRSGTFGHKQKFRRVLRALVTHPGWRSQVMAGNVREIYGRHRGPYSLLLGRERPGKKGLEQFTDRLSGPFSAEEAHEEARMLVGDSRENVTDVHVFSEGEGQFTGAFYRRGEIYVPWAELRDADLQAAGFNTEGLDGGMELPGERDEAALLSGGPQPLRQMDDPVDGQLPERTVSAHRPVRRVPPQSQAAAGAKRKGAVIELDPGNAERWPASKGAQIVRAAIEETPAAAGDLAKRLAEPLKAVGVEFPASLISRLKQGGFLRERKDND